MKIIKVDNKFPVILVNIHLYNKKFRIGFKNFDGLTIYPFIFIIPEQKNNIPLIEHEKQHVRQFFVYFILFPFLYLFNRKFRQKFEIEAYRKQLKFIPQEEQTKYRYKFAYCLSAFYRLNINIEESYNLLI